ncbi:MAG: Fibronectin type III domain protein [Elusimicrobia bacterium]|nr:MAG: Fibronectin type III domain protein [Elusimicrobiota bacterium]KAF0156979.1 MAG: Fibronectin type III domain protein [Elusimicrobiota bacterium]
MKSFNLCALILAVLLAAPAGAYDRIDFKGQIINPMMTKPAGVASDGEKVYVSDAKANAVLVFEAADGKFVRKSDAQLKSPAGLAIGNDRLYIADSGNSRVSVTDLDGKYLWSFSGKGKSPGQLTSPQGLAFGPDERLYVANTGASSIEVFNADGIYLYGFPAKRNDGVTAVKPVAIAVDFAGNIFVSDPSKSLLQQYDRAGKLLREQEIPNNGLALHPDGIIYVVNAREGKVRELGYDGSVIGTFGTRGKGRTEFQNLCGAATDPAGTLYLCDDGNKKITHLKLEGTKGAEGLKPAPLLARFTIKGPADKAPFKSDVLAVRKDGSMVAHMPDAMELVLIEKGVKKTIAPMGKLPGQLRAPKGVFAAADGKLFVSDTGNDRVQVFKADGSFDSQFGGSGAGEGKFKTPMGLTVNGNGNVYIADSRNKRVQAFSQDGIFLFAIGPQVGGLSLMNPVDAASDEKNNLYILDAGLKKVIVTDQSGKYLSTWDDSGALASPASLVYDGKGFFYVLDKGAYSVKIFDAGGRFQASFFARGAGDRELSAPQFLAYGGDRIHIADAGAGRIVTFDISYIPEAPADFAAEAGGKGVKLSWKPAGNDRIKGYKVFRSPAEGGKWAELAYTEKTSYEDASAEAGVSYRYRAAAVSTAGFPGEYTQTAKAAGAGKAEAARPAAAARDPRNVSPVEIEATELDYIFSASYKRYLNKPVGRIAVRNNTDKAFSNVKISFHLRDYMDFPHDSILESIGPKEVKEVDLMATLNNRILGITEDTPIQSQLSVTYYDDGQEKTVTLNKPIKVLSKNAIIWDRPERLATFITAKDTPVFAFSRYALLETAKLEKENVMLDENLVKALFAWEALGEEGISYLADPVNPYSKVKSGADEQMLDTVQFPRTTLKIRSGDCDDLVAMFSSIFEAGGLRAALLDYPAHIAVMFEARAADAREIGLPEEMLVRHNDAWWIPLETTMVGKDFYDAVSTAADMHRKMKDQVRVSDVRSAWSEFEPVTLPETEARYEGGEKLAPRVKKALEALLKARYEHMKKYYGNILASEPSNEDALVNLGLLHAQHGADAEAGKAFGKLLEGDPGHAAALNNLGNLAFRAGDASGASEYYHKASKADPFDADIWLNQARASLKAGRKDDAKIFVDRAVRIDPELKAVGAQLLK